MHDAKFLKSLSKFLCKIHGRLRSEAREAMSNFIDKVLQGQLKWYVSSPSPSLSLIRPTFNPPKNALGQMGADYRGLTVYMCQIHYLYNRYD